MPGANIRAANGPQGTRQEPCVIQCLLPPLVIPAQAGIQFLLLIFFRARAFARPSGARVTFLARARKVTKRTRPSACRPPRILRCGFASAACVPRIAHPCASRGIGAIHRAAPAGIAASAAAMRWGPEERRASCAQSFAFEAQLRTRAETRRTRPQITVDSQTWRRPETCRTHPHHLKR